MPEATTTQVVDALAGNERLRVFLQGNRIGSMPARQSRRVLLLEEVAQLFEPGVRYVEWQVNHLLGALFDDYVTLRRYLVDEGLLDRADGEYWRAGGSVRS